MLFVPVGAIFFPINSGYRQAPEKN